MVDNFINAYSNFNDEPKIDTNFIAKLDGFIKYLKIVKNQALENKVSQKNMDLIDKTITNYYDESVKNDNYESNNFISINDISDNDTTSIDSNEVEFVDSDESEDETQFDQFNFLTGNTYQGKQFTYEKKTEPVKIDENIEQKKINFDFYKFYEKNPNLEKRYKKYLKNCFTY